MKSHTCVIIAIWIVGRNNIWFTSISRITAFRHYNFDADFNICIVVDKLFALIYRSSQKQDAPVNRSDFDRWHFLFPFLCPLKCTANKRAGFAPNAVLTRYRVLLSASNVDNCGYLMNGTFAPNKASTGWNIGYIWLRHGPVSTMRTIQAVFLQ